MFNDGDHVYLLIAERSVNKTKSLLPPKQSYTIIKDIFNRLITENVVFFSIKVVQICPGRNKASFTNVYL